MSTGADGDADGALASSTPVALVTGGARRLGRHLSLSLAEMGYHVIVNYLSSSDEAQRLVDELTASGASSRAIQADVGVASEVTRMFASVRSKEGRLDLLINNVGIYEPGPAADLDPEGWDRCIQANLSGTFYCCHEAQPLLEATGGQVVNIGYAGVELLAGHPHALAYQVSKTGLLVLTRSLAAALAPAIRINMVSPGQLESSIDLPSDIPAAIPLGRAGTNRDIESAVRYLLGASYVTGVNIDVAGGYRLAQTDPSP